MKSASVVLGIIGGALDALFGLFLVLGGVMVGSLVGSDLAGMEQLREAGMAGPVIAVMVAIIAVLVFMVAALGIVGGIVARRKPVLGGILMLVAGVFNLLGAWVGIVVAVLLILGGVLALVAASQEKAQAAAPPTPTA